MARTTLTYPDDVDEWIEERLVQGQNRTVWLRYALETTHAVDGYFEKLFEPWQYDEREEFVEKAVQEKIERMEAESRSSNANGV